MSDQHTYEERILPGDKVITPSGKISTVECIVDNMYWLDSGIYAFRFELKKYIQGESPCRHGE